MRAKRCFKRQARVPRALHPIMSSCAVSEAVPALCRRFIVRECDGSDADARALEHFDRCMSAELLGDEDEERLALPFLQQVCASGAAESSALNHPATGGEPS